MTERTRPPVPADPIQAPGTDERRWQAWRGWDRLPEAALPTAGRVVVVAAHPDDEVLGAGGIISLLAESGVALTIVSVTDGERSHPGSELVTADELAGIRAAELHEALAELVAGNANVVRLHVPDTEVAAHEDAVAGAIRALLPGTALCLAPWTGDVHPDHEAAGRAALAAARTAGVPCLTYPVWMWHWARPDDPRVPWASAARVRLSETARERKRAAVGRYTSQIMPLGPAPQDAAILPPEEVAHHLRDTEVVFG
jgi:LmbE family N-acetylglucosaminyl deacetylase